jgi:hypothetical protein
MNYEILTYEFIEMIQLFMPCVQLITETGIDALQKKITKPKYSKYTVPHDYCGHTKESLKKEIYLFIERPDQRHIYRI